MSLQFSIVCLPYNWWILNIISIAATLIRNLQFILLYQVNIVYNISAYMIDGLVLTSNVLFEIIVFPYLDGVQITCDY